jgi:hypothetical protein
MGAADLHSILRMYANKLRAPTFPIEGFIGYLEKFAKHYALERPEFAHWATETSRKVWDVLPALADEGKCPLATDERGTHVTVSQYYVDLLHQIYRSLEDTPELPFPDEASLKLSLPPDQYRTITLDLDFNAFMGRPDEPGPPIVKVVLPESAGSLLLVPAMVPRKLLELCMVKIRHYLRAHNNKDYTMHKLAPAFQGRESVLKDALNQLLTRPFDSLNELEKGGDSSYTFWAYFTSLAKNDIRKKNDKLPEDIAALQSALVVEVFNNFYKNRAQKEREAETALRNLENQLDKPPYYYSLDEIVRFTDSRGVPLLGQFSREQLDVYMKVATTGGDQLAMPELLVLHGLKGERWFVRKTRLLPLCLKLLGEARLKVKTAITQRWYKLMADFRSEDAIENEPAFNELLLDLTDSLAPVLAAVLQEKSLFLVHEEIDGSKEGLPESSRLFHQGKLAPMSELYMLSRKDLVTDARMLLPFWQTVPFFSALLAFFNRLGQPKPAKRRTSSLQPAAKASGQAKGNGQGGNNAVKIAREDGAPPEKSAGKRRDELKRAARKVERSLVPEGRSLEACLVEQEDRWNRTLNPQAKANLTEDVNALIRDFVRKTARTIKAASFNEDRVAALAETLSDAPALEKIANREALRRYIQLYIIRLVLKS